ncbi:hypothetical protein ACUXV3_06760 [Roseobacteraceae bacterium NS-SX3]
MRKEGELMLSRRLPPRFDVAAETLLPAADPLRLAHQIRQDIWRALQAVRGFSPVVRLVQGGQGLQVTAGGRVLGTAAPGLAARVAGVLQDSANQERWLRHARRGRGAVHTWDSPRGESAFDMRGESAP